MPRPHIIIPILFFTFLIACKGYAADDHKCRDYDVTRSADELIEPPKHKTSLKGTLTESDQAQLESMRAELYRMREETWDDRYRYH